MQNNTKSSKRVLTGVVIRDKMDKTIVVSVVELAKHPKYKKVLKRRASFKAHDEKNEAKIGDTVKIIECRPISKQKHWRLIQVGKK